MSFIRKTGPLLGLAALGLAAAQPAQAKNLLLNNGDNVTVSTAGTSGTINTTTKTYAAALNANGNDAAVETDGSSIFTLAAGGKLTAGSYDTGLYVNGSGPITISGGTITAGSQGDDLFDNSSSDVNITGGTFSSGYLGNALVTFGTGTINISGGTFTAGQYGDGIFAASGIVNISGGTFAGSAFGPTGLYASQGGTINLFSAGDTSFLVNGVPMNNTTIAQGSSGTISGVLPGNTAFSTTFQDFGGTIHLNDATTAPEPSSVAAFAFIGLGAAGLMFKARKRKASDA